MYQWPIPCEKSSLTNQKESDDVTNDNMYVINIGSYRWYL